MRGAPKQSGFPLVELVITLAIASLLLAGVLAGSGTIQRQAELTSAADALRLQLKGQQSAASQAISARGSNRDGTSQDTVFGKLIEFYTDSNAAARRMRTWTLVNNPSDSTNL